MKYSVTIINHPFYPEGALMFDVSGEMVFLYQSKGGSADGDFMVWFSTFPVTDNINGFIDECAQGKYDTCGTGIAGSFTEMLEAIQTN